MAGIAEVVAARGAIYGSYRHNAELTQELARIIRGEVILDNAVVEETIHMMCHKASRMICGGHVGDSLIDMKGYPRKAVEELQDDETWAKPDQDMPIAFEAIVDYPGWPSLDEATKDFIHAALMDLHDAVATGSAKAFKAIMEEYTK